VARKRKEIVRTEYSPPPYQSQELSARKSGVSSNNLRAAKREQAKVLREPDNEASAFSERFSPEGEKENREGREALVRRFHQAKFRCGPKAKPADRRTYRGIAFKFPSARDAAEYMLDACGALPPGMTIDRIDGRRGYEPGNLRYATPKEQIVNRRFKSRDQWFLRDDGSCSS
jgi:hypothetical protein